MKSIQSSMTVTKCQEKIIYVALSFIGRIVCTSRIPCVVMCCERQAGKKVKFKSQDHESAMFKKKKKKHLKAFVFAKITEGLCQKIVRQIEMKMAC